MSLTIRSGQRTLIVPAPQGTVLETAGRAGLALSASCGGVGSCGRCMIFLERGRFRVCGEEVEIEDGGRREELACMVSVLSADAVVSAPQNLATATQSGQISTEIRLPSHDRRPAVCACELTFPAMAPGEARSMRERADDGLLAKVGTVPVSWSDCALAELAGGPGRDGGKLELLLADEGMGCEVISAAPGTALRPRLGVAIDIGTSTVVAVLVDLASGALLARAARFNQQALHADDVASRISMSSRPGEVLRLRDLVVRHTINPLIAEVCSNRAVDPADVLAVAIAGNTVMEHLFHGISPLSIGQVPFLPVARSYPHRMAAQAGLPVHPCARVYTVPAASGYIGGDIIAGLVATGFAGRSGTQLFMDIGTNGEMVLSDRGTYLACATAAGPAFEGAGLRHGCRAVEGAIDRITFEPGGQPRWTTLGKLPPIGICGSAAVDFLAAARWVGLLNPFGRFDVDRLKAIGRYVAIPTRSGVTHAFRLVDAGQSGTGEDLVVTEFDIAQLLKAKAAIYAGVKSLLHARGCKPADLDRVVLAGGFARYLNLDSAVALGLLPDLPRERYEIAGNASLSGAALSMLDVGAREAMEGWRDQLQVIELNQQPGFADCFASAMAIPYLEAGEFPNAPEVL